MLFKNSRRLLSLSSTIVSWIALCDICYVSFDFYHLFVFSGKSSSSIALLRLVGVSLPLLVVLSGKVDKPIVLIVCGSIFMCASSLALLFTVVCIFVSSWQHRPAASIILLPLVFHLLIQRMY